MITKSRHFKKAKLCFFIGIFLISTILSVPSTGRVIQDNQNPQPPNQEQGEVFNEIKIVFKESSLKYTRKTNVRGARAINQNMQHYQTVIELTTHSELLVSFFIQFSADQNWKSINDFNSSAIVKDYRENSKALLDLIQNRYSLDFFQVQSRSFVTNSFNEFGAKNNTIYEIEEKLILREATAFILALEEPFKFELNKVQLGNVQQFRYEVIFDSNSNEYYEKMQLDANGGPLELNTTTDGYNGKLFLSFFTHELENYTSPIIQASQVLVYTFELPPNQVVEYSFDQVFEEQKTGLKLQQEGDNGLTFFFQTGDIIPNFMRIDSTPEVIQFWDQLSASDYLSFSASVFIGFFTLLRLTPALVTRRAVGKYKSNFRKAILNNDMLTFKTTYGRVTEQFKTGKLNLKQFEDLIKYSKVLLDEHN